MGPKGIVSAFMAVAGVALLQIGPSLGENLLVSPGDIFSLAQALFFGIGYWRLESTSCAYPDQAARITVGQMVAVASGAIFYCLLAGEIPSLELLQHWWTNEFIVKTVLWTGLISTALAMYLETVALKVVSASELTVIMTSISLWGSAFTYFSMGEVLAPVGMLGGLMILSGCVLSSTQESPNKDT
jgi:drug/metabolite transporter (DMT)-like permease